jgi:phosphate-selective porin
LCHVDEVGFAMTLPITYSWSPLAERLKIAYEAPQGRRVNAIGGYFFLCWSLGGYVCL